MISKTDRAETCYRYKTGNKKLYKSEQFTYFLGAHDYRRQFTYFLGTLDYIRQQKTWMSSATVNNRFYVVFGSTVVLYVSNIIYTCVAQHQRTTVAIVPNICSRKTCRCREAPACKMKKKTTKH